MKKLAVFVMVAVMAVLACFGLTACGEKPLLGFDIDLAKEVCKELDIKIEFKEIDWDSKETELSSKSIDCVWNGFTYTEDRDNGYYDEERKAQIGGLDFTKMYMVNKQVAVVKKADKANYQTNADFSGKKGCAEASSAGKDVINTVLGGTAAELGKQLDCLFAIKAGTYDYGVVDITLASEYIVNEKGSYNKDLDIVELTGVKEEYYAVAFREGSNMPAVFNGILKKLYANGKAQEIAKKYSLDAALFNGFQDVPEQELPTDGDYKYIKEKGKIVIGYTIFAPMAYFAE